MTKPVRTAHLASIFRAVIEVLPANCELPSCSLHDYVDSLIRRSPLSLSLSYSDLFSSSSDAHGILSSIGVEDSPSLMCSREQAVHLMELAALVCEDTDGKGYPSKDAYSVLRGTGLMTPFQCCEAVEALEKYFTLVPKDQ